MNFFGHAVVATWRSLEPQFVLGAMLPDFASMLGVRPPAVRGDALVRGVEFHHATDRVFHESHTFHELEHRARLALRELGLPRSSTLAVAHIGVEMLLDGALVEDARGVAGYLSALNGAGADPKSAPTILWNDDGLAKRFRRLTETLAARGISPKMAEPESVAFRVERALASRPRLRLPEGGEELVRVWAAGAAAGVGKASADVLGEVALGLGLPPGGVEVPSPGLPPG
ncbi:MAG TPA: hypothetical protein VH142_09640 [Polyangiaceae bacterium]|jgi:hypothetical protein|nr:hypothetical protein [Polyangiaceae bacterium]